MIGWRVDAELVYDNGIVQWTRWYRWRWQARLVAWWAEHVSSWGGVVTVTAAAAGGDDE